MQRNGRNRHRGRITLLSRHCGCCYGWLYRCLAGYGACVAAHVAGSMRMRIQRVWLVPAKRNVERMWPDKHRNNHMRSRCRIVTMRFRHADVMPQRRHSHQNYGQTACETRVWNPKPATWSAQEPYRFDRLSGFAANASNRARASRLPSDRNPARAVFWAARGTVLPASQW